MKTVVRFLVGLSILAFAPGSAALSAQGGMRAEVPIHQRTLRRNNRRFSVPVKIGATSIEAGLDSGSTGLRVLPGVLNAADARASGNKANYSYASGVRLAGVLGTAIVSIGSLSGTAGLQLVESVGCTAKKPNCSAVRLAAGQFGIMGSGIAGEGFKAILGVSMTPAGIPNPLVAMGVKRWIIELPRSSSDGAGRLVLNPTDAEVGGYAMFPVHGSSSSDHGAHDAIRACLVNERTRAKACGWLNMDTGAAGIQVLNSNLRRRWRKGTPVLLTFGGEDAPQLTERLITGDRAGGSRVLFKSSDRISGVAIHAGVLPYLAFSVLYDPQQGLIGLKPRPSLEGGPRAGAEP